MKARLLCALLLVGCGAQVAESGPREAPTDHLRLERATTEHNQLLEKLANAAEPQLESCRFSSGDCLLQVAESRGQLVSRLGLNACEEVDALPGKSRCITQQLETGTGHGRELLAYVSLENWCFKQLTACVVAKAEEAQKAVVDARFSARKQALEQASESVAARRELKLALSRIDYLRSTLPPDAAVCARGASYDSCLEQVEAGRRSLDERLYRDDFQPASAVESYVALQRSEAACERPELDCLSSALGGFGVYPESRKWVDRNFSLLAEREKLLSQVSQETGQRCVSDSRRDHQAGIVSAYVAYVHEPVLYFRTQLDKAFLELHQAQVTCLSQNRKAPRPSAVVAASH